MESMIQKRLIREKALWNKPPENIRAHPSEDLRKWEFCIRGAIGSPYAKLYLRLQANIPAEYPNKPPEIKFITPIMHPNISVSSGSICTTVLKLQTWLPGQNLLMLVSSIYALLMAPNPDSPLNGQAASLYKTDYNAYKVAAREHTMKDPLCFQAPTWFK